MARLAQQLEVEREPPSQLETIFRTERPQRPHMVHLEPLAGTAAAPTAPQTQPVEVLLDHVGVRSELPHQDALITTPASPPTRKGASATEATAARDAFVGRPGRAPEVGGSSVRRFLTLPTPRRVVTVPAVLAVPGALPDLDRLGRVHVPDGPPAVRHLHIHEGLLGSLAPPSHSSTVGCRAGVGAGGTQNSTTSAVRLGSSTLLHSMGSSGTGRAPPSEGPARGPSAPRAPVPASIA